MVTEKIKNQESLVTVGILTYKRTQTFKRALKSIIFQTYKNLEIIVSENFSPGYEEKEKFIKNNLKKDKRIIYYQHKPNKGIYFNIDFVLKRAKGKYFMWAADDDYWDKNFIKLMVQELEAHSNAGVALSAVKLLRTNKPAEVIRIVNSPNNKNVYQTFWEALHPATSKYNYFISGFFRRKLLCDVFLPVADFYTPDIIFIILFSLVAPFRYVDRVLYYCGSVDSTYRLEEERNEINVFSFWGEIVNPFKLFWAIIVSPQVMWTRKFCSVVGFLVLLFRLFMLMVIKILALMIFHSYRIFNWMILKMSKLHDSLYRRYYCSK